MARVYNFSAGPAVLPEEVLKEAADEMLDYQGTGMSVMEKERGLDRSAAIADMRFTFIEKICESTVVKPKESRERIRSERIDRKTVKDQGIFKEFART